jgi:tryptophan synthase beta chain
MARKGYYGEYGGQFLPEILVATIQNLEKVFAEAQRDPGFYREYERILSTYSCRPTPLTPAENLSHRFGRGRIFVKREDLNHTGSHKLNNVIGQGLLVKRMGKTRVIAETGAGQHGVATATMAARFGFECTIYMGEVDVERQRPNVFWMERLGAKVVPVTTGTRILKDAINEALRDWVSNMDSTHYVLGTACGAHPFPAIVAYFQAIVGKEARAQVLEAWASSTIRWNWSAWKPAAKVSPPAGTRRAWPAQMLRPAWPRATRRFSCKTMTARCARPTAWPPGSIISACRPSSRICVRKSACASRRPPTVR